MRNISKLAVRFTATEKMKTYHLRRLILFCRLQLRDFSCWLIHRPKREKKWSLLVHFQRRG